MDKNKDGLTTKDASKDFGNYLIQIKDKQNRTIQGLITSQCIVSIIDLEGQSTSFEIK